jgi:hypothetical protein
MERGHGGWPVDEQMSGQQRFDALAHLAGRLVRERQRQDLPRGNTVRDQARDAARDHRGLA